MDNGEISLRAELDKMENPEEIKKLAEDAEMSGYEDVAKMAKEKLEAIWVKANTVEKTSESQISQVESMGGSAGEIEKRTEGIYKQIEEVKTQTQEKIIEVQNENKEEVKIETQEKTEEIQSKPEVKNTGMTEAEKEESNKVYEKKQEYNNKVDGLTKEELQLDAQLDYVFLKKDIPNFQKLLIQKFENRIQSHDLYIQQLKETELTQKASNPSYDRSSDIESQKSQIQRYKERIQSAQKDVTGLYEYNTRVDGRGSSANERINGLTPSQLVYKYYQDIERFNEADRKHFAPGNKGTGYPHKFDKLVGLVDIAKQEGDIDLLNSIKRLNLELPEEIKTKLN